MRDTVLIVDDQSSNRESLIEILRNDYKIKEAVNGIEALEVISKNRESIAAMLLDLVMPKMGGQEVLAKMSEAGLMEDFPVLVSAGKGNLDVLKKCFEYGICDFVKKPYEDDLVLEKVKKLDSFYQSRRESNDKLRKFAKVLQNQNKILEQKARQQKSDNISLMDSLGTIVEYRNTENHEHIKRVKAFTKILATHMMKEFPEYELTEEKIDQITAASALHDIGKIMIPDNILFKPGKYTSEEFDYMKSHTIRGYDIIAQIADNWDKELMDYCKQIARSHHEKFDGRGYPENIKGDKIPIAAQIVSVTDCFEALISESLYKKAYSFDAAFQMILNGDCGAFNPKLIEAFRNSRGEFHDIASEGAPIEDAMEEANVQV